MFLFNPDIKAVELHGRFLPRARVPELCGGKEYGGVQPHEKKTNSKSHGTGMEIKTPDARMRERRGFAKWRGRMERATIARRIR